MLDNPDISGPRAPPQPYQRPEVGPADFHRLVPDVSLVFNPAERSALMSARGALLPAPASSHTEVRRSSSVPSRIGITPRYSNAPQPSPLSRPPPQARLSDNSAESGPSPSQTVTTAAAVSSAAHRSRPPSQSLQSTAPIQQRPLSAAEPGPRDGNSPGSRSAGSGSSESTPAGAGGCCSGELRTVLRIVADNGRQLATLRGQLAALIARDNKTAAAVAPRTVLVKEAQTQTELEAETRTPTATVGVNTSFTLLATPRRDLGADPVPALQEPAARDPAVLRRVQPAVTRAGSGDSPGGWPLDARRESTRMPRGAAGAPESRGTPRRGRGAARSDGITPPRLAGTESLNTVQVQARRVQQWVEADGWAGDDEELTLRGVVLPPVLEQPPSPEPSVHVNMHEYQPSQDGSLDGSEVDVEEERPEPDKTFFQNVMGQVNMILDGAGVGTAPTQSGQQHQHHQQVPEQRGPVQQQHPEDAESDPVRRATLKQLRAAGVSFHADTPQGADRSVFDYSCVPRAPAAAAAALPCTSDLSLEVNTLAIKYVGSRPLLHHAAAVGGRPSRNSVQSHLLGKENLAPGGGRTPTDITLYGISDSNMSFSTRKYMEKFNLQNG